MVKHLCGERFHAGNPAGASRDERFETLMQQTKHLRGTWETLARCGAVLEACQSIKWIIADGHGSHAWMKQLLLGQTIKLPDDLRSLLPFFAQLQMEDLPKVSIPLPYRIVRHNNETVHFLPGAGTIKKHFLVQHVPHWIFAHRGLPCRSSSSAEEFLRTAEVAIANDRLRAFLVRPLRRGGGRTVACRFHRGRCHE